MKFSFKATSVIEAIVTTTIITVGITWMYTIYTSSIRLSDTTANKIQAIQIAREGIEAVSNIRDTNWLLFSSDYDNCWMTLNYNNLCIWNNGNTYDIAHNGNYLVYQGSDNRWYLSWATAWTYETSSLYRDGNRVWLDSDGFYSYLGVEELKPLFTRVIHFSYQEPSGLVWDSDSPMVNITSKVEWRDASSNKAHTVELSTLLSNWKR